MVIYEMRARVPTRSRACSQHFGCGMRLVRRNAEVDIVEKFHNQQPGKITSTLHFPATLGSNVSKNLLL